MTQRRSRSLVRLVPPALLFAMLLCSVPAIAGMYLPDGTKSDGAGGYTNPNDGMCVIGIKLDGTMLVDWSITNARDCVAWTRSEDGLTNLSSMTTQAACQNAGGAGNDGWRHGWSTSLCYDAVNNRGLSRVDLDNTDSMCFSKGGTVVTTGKCVAYGWVYLNRKADGTLPVTGTGLGQTTGVQAADNLGFCATTMRMTSATFTSATTCPSKHNSRANADPVGGPYVEWPDCLSSTTNGCQTQASYDAGLGWAWDSANSRCNYTYGVIGVLNAAATKADGTTYAAGTTQDLTVFTTQGACLANGYAWDNWLTTASSTTATNATPGELAGLPAGATIRKLDATTLVKDGGGNFISGTGAVCQKCHSDQSRSYQERDKPGYPETRHKLAGDATGKPFQQYFTAANSAWGLKGVQCNICHSTAKAAQDDLLQVVPAGLTNAGNPKSATGHNQTEYGAHVNGVCYGCHGTATNPTSGNPAATIAVSQGDFALTAKGLAPISNQFLNSPHAKYTGTSTKMDVGDRTKYASSFLGYVCRTGAGKLTTYASSNACTTAGHTWYTTTSNGSFCYYNQASCTALPGGQWNTTFSAPQYPWAADTGGPAAVCAGIGVGSIITTAYQNGAAVKIPIVDTATNPTCTAVGDGSPASGAAGFWIKEGEAVSGGTPPDTSQGNCMTCHDVHWALDSTHAEAEPIRRECTTCHSNSGSSVSGAPQVDLNVINHLKTPGTPLENWLTEPAESCEICHMPNSGTGNSSRAHLWRINTDVDYKTMGYNKANLTNDGNAWVDLDLACGQCHGGGEAQVSTTGTIANGASALHVTSTAGLAVNDPIKVAGAASGAAPLYSRIVSIAGTTVNLADTAGAAANGAAVLTYPTKNNAPYYSKTAVAAVAKGIHESAGVNYPVTFTYTIDVLTVDVVAQVSCGGTCPAFSYDWDWGDATAHGTLEHDSHTYATAGAKTITLTVRLASNGALVGSSVRSLTLQNPDLAPAPAATCTWDANTWTMQILDATHDDGPDADALTGDGDATTRVTVDWGDGSARATITVGGTRSYTYKSAGTFTVSETAVDSKAQSASASCATQATPAYFYIAGTVLDGNGAPVSRATVRVRQGRIVVRTLLTGPDGTYTTGGTLKPGTYTIEASKTGWVFANNRTATIGPSSDGNTITGTAVRSGRAQRPRHY